MQAASQSSNHLLQFPYLIQIKIPMKILKQNPYFFLTIALSFVTDQVTKYLAFNFLSTPIILTQWFNFRYEQNFGIAWSIQIPYFLLIFLNIILIIGIVWFTFARAKHSLKIVQVILGTLIGGALGNLFVRLFRGFVIDFISIGTFPVFNLADSFITISIFCIVLFYDTIARKP